MRAETPVAVVTGAAGGIGGAVVEVLLSQGWAVVGVDLAADPSGSASADASTTTTAYAVRGEPDRALRWVRGDVADEAVLDRAVVAARGLGSLRGLVTATLVESRSPLAELDRATLTRAFDLQAATAWAWGTAVAGAAGAAGQEGASIVHVSSVHAERAAHGMAAYAMAKAALAALTRATALEWGPSGVRCNAVLPGFVPVARNAARWSDPEAAEQLLAHHPLGRFVRPADVAEAVAFLLSPAAAGITGVTLPVDGGMLAALPDWA